MNRGKLFFLSRGNSGWSLVFVICIFGNACKPPLPVYFDKPIGVKVQGFDTLIAGNYIPLEDVLEKGTKEFTEKYVVGYDKIVPKEFSNQPGKELNYEDLKTLAGLVSKDSIKKEITRLECDSLFRSFCSFNELASVRLGSAIEKKGPRKPQAAMVKIAYDRIFFIAVDSAGMNSRDTLVSLSPSCLLTKYSGKYFLNLKTLLGWEVMQMEVWENHFLSVKPFYFTGYNDCARNAAELLASTANIYPGLQPVFSPAKKVVGFRAAMNPQVLVQKFTRSEGAILLLRIR